MRIMIIGGTGFIGTHVTAHLVRAGHQVTLLHRGTTELVSNGVVEEIKCSRDDIRTLHSEIARQSPDVVIDTIPYCERDARIVMDAFRGVAKRVIAVGSMDVYAAYGRFIRQERGSPDPGLLTEHSALRRHLYPYRAQAESPSDMLYVYEKILVERVVLNDPKLFGTVLRLPKVYGPGDKQHHLFAYLNQMDSGQRTILLEDSHASWRWTRGYVENVAGAIALAAGDKRPGNHLYNVGAIPALTEAQWIQSIARAAGWNGELKIVRRRFLPRDLALPFDWRHHLAADTSRLRLELGYREMTDVDAALAKTVAWQRTNSPPQIA